MEMLSYRSLDQQAMADGTGLKEFQEPLKTNDILPIQENAWGVATEEHPQAQLEHIARLQESFQITLHNIENSLMIMQQQVQCSVEKLQTYNRNKSVLGNGLTASAVEKNLLGNASRNESTGQSMSGGYTYFPEVKFPHFKGDNPRAWIRTCNRYFQFFSTIGEDQKVPLASLHLEGKADVWFAGSMEGKGSLSWQEFVSAVLERFEDLDCEKVMRKFCKLQQETTVNAYLDKFEELNSYMMEFFKDLNEEFFIMKFISGLRKDIRGIVSIMKPKTLNQAISLAKKQEVTADAIVKRVNHLQKLHLTKPPFRSQNAHQTPNPSSQTTKFNPKSHTEVRKLLTEAETRATKEKNLSNNCDETVVVPGHKCKVRQLYLLENEEESKAYAEDVDYIEEQVEEVEDEDKAISIKAMAGSKDNTLRMKGKVNGKDVNILDATGSTDSL